jgi:hypothetical protein
MGAMQLHKSATRLLWCVILCSLPLTACGGRMVNKNMAQKLIADLPQEAFRDRDVEILTIDQIAAGKVVVKTKVETAFAFEKVGNRWVVRQIRIGQGQWEKLDNILRALKAVKVAETEQMLNALAAAIEKYQQQNGRLPEFKDFVTLSDALNPTYLTPLIRMDAWQRAFEAKPVYPGGIRIVSAGPDGSFGTGDDLVKFIPASEVEKK